MGFLPSPTSMRSGLSKSLLLNRVGHPFEKTVLSSATSLEELDREELLEYLNSDSLGLSFQEYQKREQQKSYLSSCPLFTEVGPSDRDRICASMEEVKVARGTVLIQQGDVQGDCMYFLVKGELEAKDNSTILKTYNQPGDYFGELALIFKGQARQATIEASTESIVYRLNKTAFQESMQDSPMFDTARQMLLKKYSSKNLWSVLRKIHIDEGLDLIQAKLFSLSMNPNNVIHSIYPFAMGASFSVLACFWTRGIRDPRTDWPILFDVSSKSAKLSMTKLPLQLSSFLLALSAIVSDVSISKDVRSTVTKSQRVNSRLHGMGVWAMVLLWAKGLASGQGKAKRSAIAFLPLQMLLSILLEITKRRPTTSTATEGGEQDQQQPPKPIYFPAIAACMMLGYEVLRCAVGALSV